MNNIENKRENEFLLNCETIVSIFSVMAIKSVLAAGFIPDLYAVPHAVPPW
jgi:hypothetical protein